MTVKIIELPKGFEYLEGQTCPETGLVVQRYVSSIYDEDWTPGNPEGWEVFDDQYDEDGDHEADYLKHYEHCRTRRIGPSRMVWALSAAAAGAVFTPAEMETKMTQTSTTSQARNSNSKLVESGDFLANHDVGGPCDLECRKCGRVIPEPLIACPVCDPPKPLKELD